MVATITIVTNIIIFYSPLWKLTSITGLACLVL